MSTCIATKLMCTNVNSRIMPDNVHAYNNNMVYLMTFWRFLSPFEITVNYHKSYLGATSVKCDTSEQVKVVATHALHMSAALVTVWLPGQCDVTWKQGLLSGWGHCECLVDRGCLQEKDCSTEYNCLI